MHSNSGTFLGAVPKLALHKRCAGSEPQRWWNVRLDNFSRAEIPAPADAFQAIRRGQICESAPESIRKSERTHQRYLRNLHRFQRRWGHRKRAGYAVSSRKVGSHLSRAVGRFQRYTSLRRYHLLRFKSCANVPDFLPE